MMKVPYNDLSRIHGPLSKELEQIFKNTLDSSQFIGGDHVENFERKFENVFNVQNAVACGNGTDAILGCLKALNLAPGDEVIVPAMTWISSAEVVNLAGGTPVFCDVDEASFVAEADNIRSKITEKTKGVILVHLYGNMPKMNEIMALVDELGLWLIEDCAQAHLSSFNSKSAGTFGDFGTFSFFPGKNLGAFGDAGAACASNVKNAKYLRAFFNHGAINKHDHFIIGTNSRLDAIQAQILNTKLSLLEEWTKDRIRIAQIYEDAFSDRNSIKTQFINDGVVNSRHIYPIIVDDRKKYTDALSRANIAFNLNYPRPLHKQRTYYDNNRKTNLEVSELIAGRAISLPIFPKMRLPEIQHVINVVGSV
jgi:dTDP-4-amino-4,6-dideoxygalactose transaminase